MQIPGNAHCEISFFKNVNHISLCCNYMSEISIYTSHFNQEILDKCHMLGKRIFSKQNYKMYSVHEQSVDQRNPELTKNQILLKYQD